jgi:DNA-binding NarL/FixJ family response regulator
MQEPLSILILDPDSQTIEKVKEATQGCLSVIIPCSSPDAIFDTVLQQKPVEVIILELERPFDKAFDLLSDLKARVQAEVVFVSRFDDEVLWIEAIQRGAYDYLCKPLDLSELKRILLHAVEKHRPGRVMKRPPAQAAKIMDAKADFKEAPSRG